MSKPEAVQQIPPPRVPGRLVLRSLRRPRPLTQRKLRHGLPPTVVHTNIMWGQRARPSVTSPVAVASTPPIAPQPATIAAANVLALRGNFWDVKYGGQAAIVEDCRGLRYIAVLMRNAAAGNGPVHAKELVAIATGQPVASVELEAVDPLLDDVARTQLFTRLEELAGDRREATARNDEAQLAMLDEEYERIAGVLAEGATERRRPRRGTFTHDGEKARKAVGKAISEAIAKVASHPQLSALAEHLISTIHKGLWLSYSGGVAWEIDAKL